MARRRDRSGMTRRQSSRVARETQMQQAIIIGAIIVAVIVVGLVGYAFLNQYYLEPNKAIITVNDDEISASDFKDRIKFEYYRNFGVQPPAQIGIDPVYLGQIIRDGMIDDLLIEQHAEELGITVPEDELEERLELSFGYDAGEPEPTSTPFPTVAPTDDNETPTVTPTFVYTPTQSPTATLQPGVTPTATSTPSPTPDGPTATPSPTATAPPTPTPETITEQDFVEQYEEFVSEASSITGISEARIRELVRRQMRLALLREKLLEELGFEAEETSTQVHAAHILVESEEQAQAVLERIEEGEEFEVVAAEVSTDVSNAYRGGDLGWFGEGRMVPAFEEAVFALDEGEISDPVQTQFGWHVIKVYEKEEIELTPSQKQQAVAQQFQERLDQWQDEADVTIEDTWQEHIPEQLP